MVKVAVDKSNNHFKGDRKQQPNVKLSWGMEDMMNTVIKYFDYWLK